MSDARMVREEGVGAGRTGRDFTTQDEHPNTAKLVLIHRGVFTERLVPRAFLEDPLAVGTFIRDVMLKDLDEYEVQK